MIQFAQISQDNVLRRAHYRYVRIGYHFDQRAANTYSNPGMAPADVRDSYVHAHQPSLRRVLFAAKIPAHRIQSP